MRQGEVITAEVVRVDYNFVVVNAGLKSEAYVPIEEFKDDRGEVTVQPGDFISVAIEIRRKRLRRHDPQPRQGQAPRRLDETSNRLSNPVNSSPVRSRARSRAVSPS